MPKNKDLETVEIRDVEFLAVGTWRGKNGLVTFTDKDLENIVSAFDELIADKELNYEPPVKLGHAANQHLLQENGYPAAGWVSAVRKVGKKLFADLKDVPKKIGELIKVRAYKVPSAEVYSEYEMGDKKYPKVLKAISLLGADIPAVKTLNDIVAQYSAEDEAEVVFYELVEESLTKRVDAVYQTWNEQRRGGFETDAGYVCEVYGSFVIVSRSDEYYKIPYSVSETGEHVFDTAKAVQVERVYQEINNENKEELMEKELREVLELAEDADILEAVRGLKEKADAAAEPVTDTVSLSEHEAVVEENSQLGKRVTTLETQLAERDRNERVKAALGTGKITPAQKDWADQYALSDPDGFDAYVAAAPVVVELGERGTSGESAEVQLSEEEIKQGEQMGNTKEDLIAAKKQEVA